MNITKLDQVVELVKTKPKKRLIAAYANDEHTIEAVYSAAKLGVVNVTLVGDKEKIVTICNNLSIDSSLFNIIHETIDTEAVAKSCELINNGEGDILMKGLLSTDKYMRAILNKEKGLLPPKALLTHIAIIENPQYHKLLIVGDCAIIPAPDLNQKAYIINKLIKTSNSIGIDSPKIAVLAATEQVLDSMQASLDAAILSKMGERGQFANATIEGPLALDIAIDAETAHLKKFSSSVAGDADCLLFPNIESGNVFYKCCTKFDHAEVGAFLAGAKVPCVLSSRGDSSKTKLYSIAMASIFC